MANGSSNGNGNGYRYLSPKVIQGVGLAILVFAVAVWALTDRQSALFVSSAITLIGIGAYKGATERLSKVINPAPVGEGEGANERA